MTVKERLHRLVDTLPDEEAEVAARILEALHALPSAAAPLRQDDPTAEADFYARLRAAGLRLTPARPLPDRWNEPLPDLPGVDLSGAVLQEREEALQRWD